MKKKSIAEQRLEELESEFRPLLIACLEQCGRGRWGLFGQNSDAEVSRFYPWEEAERVKEMAAEIRRLRAEFGVPSPLVERLLHYCSLRGSNVPGEPKLAKQFLEEISTGEF